jgi:lactoylglutathione lyase
MLDEGETTCCYARSDKHWVTDPQGIAWEHFHTLSDVPVFGQGKADAPAAAAGAGACCTPAPARRAAGIPVKASPGCC